METLQPSPFTGVDIPNDDILTNCMHCGLCLPTCPTYVLTGLEKSSPRGRIRLIKSVAEGTLPMSPGFIEEMHFCLDCQACETACPAGVRYGSVLEAARAQIFQSGKEGWFATVLKKVLLGWFFRVQSRLKILARLLRMMERTGMRRFMERSRLVRHVAPSLQRIQPLSPKMSAAFSSDTLAEFVPAVGTARYRVGFLTGCIMDVAFADVNRDTVDLLRLHGCNVVIPQGQACCGSLQAHNGDIQSARAMARNIVDLFSREPLDFVVMNSAGCGAYLKEYGHVLADDPEYAERAAALSGKTKDITEFLVHAGFRPTRNPSPGVPVTYHDACHLAHTQKVVSQPRALLRQIPGLAYVELTESTWCCGSAGIYNVTRYDDAVRFLERKVGHIRASGARVIVTGNPGCMLQIQHGLNNEGIPATIVHTATFLRRACET